MTNIFQTALSMITGVEPSISVFQMPKKSNRPFQGLSIRELIQLESEIGKDLFGPIPAGHRRSFFNLDADTWIWHEEYIDPATGKRKTGTTRYEVHEKGILKAQDGARYSFIEGEELRNLTVAVQMYYERCMREIYHRDPKTGHMLATTPR